MARTVALHDEDCCSSKSLLLMTSTVVSVGKKCSLSNKLFKQQHHVVQNIMGRWDIYAAEMFKK
eukprot:3708722-Rhodomonas_salina.1